MKQLLSALILVVSHGCSLYPFYPRQTPYPGSGLGIVEAIRESKPAPTVTYRGAPLWGPPPFGLPAVESPHHFHYQIRDKDGTLHIVGSEVRVKVGSCVAFSGYADGPSRTHWSLSRVMLERSLNCQ